MAGERHIPRGSGMVTQVRHGESPVLLNFHNQAVTRARYQGPRGVGFAVEFLPVKSQRAFEASLDEGVVLIREANIAAAVATGDMLKQKLRAYLDGTFPGSRHTGNNHRRATNAMVQSVVYHEVGGEPGFAYLLYSKLGRGRGAGFIDYLLLHLRGGTVAPPPDRWLMIAIDPETRRLQKTGGRQPTGYFRAAHSSVFFRKSADGKEMYLLRQDTRTGRTRLLAILLKSLRIPARLSGLQPIFDGAGAMFERQLDLSWRQFGGEQGA